MAEQVYGNVTDRPRTSADTVSPSYGNVTDRPRTSAGTVSPLEGNADDELLRYEEAYMIKTYSGVTPESLRGGTVIYDEARKVDAIYVDLPSGGRVHIGDRPSAPADIAQTDLTVKAEDQALAAGGIESVVGAKGNPTLEDYLAAGYTEQEVRDFEAQRMEQFASGVGAGASIQYPVTLTPEQIQQYAAQPGAETVAPRAESLRDRVQSSIYKAMDAQGEAQGPVADTINAGLRLLTGSDLIEPADMRFWSNYLTDLVDITTPVAGGVMSMDEGARIFNSGWQNGNPVDMLIGGALTGIGGLELVPLVQSLTDPAKELLKTMSPEAKSIVADMIGASRAIAQGDKDMLLEVFQPRGTPRNLSAAGVDTSYRMQHQPRGPQDDTPVRLDDLTKSTTGEQAGYPEDFYSPSGPRLYAPGPQFAGDDFGKANAESYRIIKSVKGNPDAEVTIYRAVPNDPGITTINEGDFVTLSKTYAELHGASGYGRSGDEAGKVISQKVRVKDIYWDGNDVNEFGYFPEVAATSLEGMLRQRHPDATINLSGTPERGYELSRIVIPEGQRESGLGTKIMEDMIRMADEQGARISLTPDTSFGGTSVSRLKDFYKRFGFVENKGKNKDFSTRNTMYRDPQPSGSGQTDTGASVLEMNLSANKKLANLFETAGVSLESPTEDIAAVLLRAGKADIIDPRTADDIISGLKGK